MPLTWASAQRAISSAVMPLFSARPGLLLPGKLNTATPADMYRVLRAYYRSNGLYDELSDILRQQGVAKESLKPLRNPTFRVTEFYAGKLWPGTLPDALPIKADKPAIVKPIQQVWK